MSCGKVVIVVDGAGIFLGACFTGWFCGKGRRGGGFNMVAQGEIGMSRQGM
jgi:hypothetical protein